jgi:hypothetical protein
MKGFAPDYIMNVLKIVFFIALGFLSALGGLFTDTGTSSNGVRHS